VLCSPHGHRYLKGRSSENRPTGSRKSVQQSQSRLLEDTPGFGPFGLRYLKPPNLQRRPRLPNRALKSSSCDANAPEVSETKPAACPACKTDYNTHVIGAKWRLASATNSSARAKLDGGVTRWYQSARQDSIVIHIWRAFLARTFVSRRARQWFQWLNASYGGAGLKWIEYKIRRAAAMRAGWPAARTRQRG